MEQNYQDSTMNLGSIAGMQNTIPNLNSVTGVNQQYTATIPAQPVGQVNNIPAQPVGQVNNIPAQPVGQVNNMFNEQVQPNVNNVQPIPEAVPPVYNSNSVSSIYNNISNAADSNVYSEPEVQLQEAITEVSGSVQLNQSNSEQITSTQVTQTQSVESYNVKQEEKLKDPIIKNNFAIPVPQLRSMIKTIKLAAVCNKNIPLSSVIEINLATDGLKAKGTDMLNVISYHDQSIRFATPLNIAIEMETLEKLVDKLDEDKEVEFVTDVERGLITLISDGDEFLFPQINDDQTFQPLHIPEICAEPNTTPVKIDYNEFKAKLGRALLFTSNKGRFKTLMSICLSDKIYSTDSDNAYAEPNLPELVNETFCISADMLKIIGSLELEGDVYLALSKNVDGVVESIHIYNNYITLSGHSDLRQAEFPLEQVKQLLQINYDMSIMLPRVHTLKSLEKASIFIDRGSDEDCSEFNVSVGDLKINSKNGRAKLSILVDGVENNLPIFELNIFKVIDALSNLSEDNVALNIINGQQNVVCFSSNDIVELLSIQNSNN